MRLRISVLGMYNGMREMCILLCIVDKAYKRSYDGRLYDNSNVGLRLEKEDEY